MRLSDAMATGRVLKEHVPYPSTIDGATKGCALQIAMAALGIETYSSFLKTTRAFPWTMARVRCPECGKINEVYAVIGTCLNDTHKWNLDRIIDFVRSIEPAEDDDTSPSGQPDATQAASDLVSQEVLKGESE